MYLYRLGVFSFSSSFIVYPYLESICIPVAKTWVSKPLSLFSMLISDFNLPKSARVPVRKTTLFLFSFFIYLYRSILIYVIPFNYTIFFYVNLRFSAYQVMHIMSRYSIVQGPFSCYQLCLNSLSLLDIAHRYNGVICPCFNHFFFPIYNFGSSSG